MSYVSLVQFFRELDCAAQVAAFLLACACVANCAIDLTKYTLKWNQDFTTGNTLSVSAHGPINVTKGPIWIAHKPDGEDWVKFIDPSGPFKPFNVGGGNLTIRAQRQSDGTYTAGILSSMDQWGNGFAQGFGYFECKAKLPTGLGTWPAFWLMDAPSLVDRTKDAHELDIMEQYGDGPALMRSTLHFWSNNHPSTPTWGAGGVSVQPSMETGFHTYGFDYQADYLTFYYDREIAYQVPNFIPVSGLVENTYTRPMFVMVNLAYGGGGSSNAASALNDNKPRDMAIQYVKVWSGTGGSALANSTTRGALSLAYDCNFQILSGQRIDIRSVSLQLNNTGNLAVYNRSTSSILWQTGSNQNCGSPAACKFVFQCDGNFVGYNPNGAYWGSSTYNKNASALMLANSSPYLRITDQNGKNVWQSA